MGPKPEKIIPTRDDVLKVFAEGEGPARHPMGTSDLARAVAEAHGGDWHDPFARLSRTTLVRLLEEMTVDRTLVMCLGEEWGEEGVSFYDQRPGVRYWTTRERSEEWRRRRTEEAADREQEARQVAADAYAVGFLRKRHPEEYRALVAEFFAELEKEQGK